MTAKYKLTKARLTNYLSYLREGQLRGQAAQSIGVTSDAIRKYVRQNPDFQDEIDSAEMDACDPIESSLYRSAIEGNLGAQIFWLTNRNPKKWQNTQRTQTEHTGEVTFRLVEEED